MATAWPTVLPVSDHHSNDLRVIHSFRRTHARIAASKELLWQSAEVLLRSMPVRRIAGGSDAELITPALSTAPICSPCLAQRVHVATVEIERALAAVAMTVRVVTETGSCAVCRALTTTVRLPGGPLAAAATAAASGRGSSGAPEPRPPSTSSLPDAVWHVLENRRGQLFCMACISAALGETRRIDRAVMVAEGRGALRRHGPCAGCGRDRLLCGVGR